MLTPHIKKQKDEKMIETIRKRAAEFLERESNGKSIITVTRVVLSDDKKRARILFTVFPTSYEEQAHLFAERNMSDFLTFLKKRAKIARLPMLSFDIDEGEKNRQRIEVLTNAEHDTLDADTDA